MSAKKVLTVLAMVLDCNIRENDGTAIVVRTATIASTTINSSNVNPLACFFHFGANGASGTKEARDNDRTHGRPLYAHSVAPQLHAWQVQQAQSRVLLRCKMKIFFFYPRRPRQQNICRYLKLYDRSCVSVKNYLATRPRLSLKDIIFLSHSYT